MASFSVRKLTPLILENFTITSGVRGLVLDWDGSANIDDTYEIWKNTSNSLSTASLLVVPETNSYVDTDIIGSTDYYYWVRTKNKYGNFGPYTLGAEPGYLTGATFNTLYGSLYVSSTNTVTVSINQITAQAWWQNADGSFDNSPVMQLTTPIVSPNDGYTSVTTPDNARLNDSSFAVAALTGSAFSNDLRFSLSDIGVPNDATVLGIKFYIKSKTTDRTRSSIVMVITDSPNAGANYITPDSTYILQANTANNTEETFSLGSATNTWYLNEESGTLGTAPAVITSVDVKAPTTIGSVSSGVSGSNSSPTVSSYGVWYESSNGGFTANANNVVLINQYIVTTVSGVSSSGVQILDIKVRSRLYDNTAGADVPGGTKEQIIYHTFGANTYGSLTAITNFNDSFVVGFRGLLIPGHTYTLYVEAGKFQTSGSPTATLTVNGGGVLSSSAGSLS